MMTSIKDTKILKTHTSLKKTKFLPLPLMVGDFLKKGYSVHRKNRWEQAKTYGQSRNQALRSQGP